MDGLSGLASELAPISAAEKFNPASVGLVSWLTLMAPEIIEAVLAGKQDAGLPVAVLKEPFPRVWAER